MQLRIPILLWVSKTPFWFMVPSWISRSLSSKLLPSWCPQLVLVHGAVPLQVQGLARLLVKLTPVKYQSWLVTSFASFPLSKNFIYIDGGDEPWLLLFCRWWVKLFKLLSLSDNLSFSSSLMLISALNSSTCGNSSFMMANLPHRIEVHLLWNSLPSSN